MSPRPVRRNQSISTFGVGAMIDFPGPVTLIHCGLDVWPFKEFNPEHNEFKIEDEKRLANKLGVKFFVQPMDFRDNRNEKNIYLKLPFHRFPTWHYCPSCGLMEQAALHDKTNPKCEGPLSRGKRKGEKHKKISKLQVRFVCACPKGHLRDFPFWEWVFKSSNPKKEGRHLRMIFSSTASLGGVKIECEEHGEKGKITTIKTASLQGSYKQDSEGPLAKLGIRCKGENPSLGIPNPVQAAPGCGEELRVLLTAASNLYFHNVASSIYLPPHEPNPEIQKIITHQELLILLLSKANKNENNPNGLFPKNEKSMNQLSKIISTYENNVGKNSQVTTEELITAVNQMLEGSNEASENDVTISEENYLKQEYDLFLKDYQNKDSDLLVKKIKITDFDSNLSEYFQNISLIHKLRETRVLTGYSRINPSEGKKEERALLSKKPTNWLPGIIVRGEGIFLEVHEDKIQKWLENKGVQKRLHKMGEISEFATRIKSSKFILLHTLSHLIINQLIFDCGYGSASIRERLYCSEGENPMSGILIYTASGDSEGSMGGLVRMGKPGFLEPIVQRAFEKARWCSSDPICIESEGQGIGNCNLAACHSCTLLPETSCETGNHLLDRGLVVGTLDDSSIGFIKTL